MHTGKIDAADRVGLLLAEPLALADYDRRHWNRFERNDLDALQLEGLKRRFAQFREIPMLKKLADGEGIDQVASIEDVVPLLFEHTVYKAYPPSLLDRSDFARINKWLTKLVVPELAEAIADEVVLKVVLSWLPRPCIAVIAATAMSAAMRPYSIAVAPDSSLRNRSMDVVQFFMLKLQNKS